MWTLVSVISIPPSEPSSLKWFVFSSAETRGVSAPGCEVRPRTKYPEFLPNPSQWLTVQFWSLPLSGPLSSFEKRRTRWHLHPFSSAWDLLGQEKPAVLLQLTAKWNTEDWKEFKSPTDSPHNFSGLWCKHLPWIRPSMLIQSSPPPNVPLLSILKIQFGEVEHHGQDSTATECQSQCLFLQITRPRVGKAHVPLPSPTSTSTQSWKQSNLPRHKLRPEAEPSTYAHLTC